MTTQSPQSPSRRIRVLVFGATGIGKTSLCNALARRSRPIDSGAKGVTAKSHLYPAFRAGDFDVELVDTVGLHESAHGTVPADKAAVALVELLEKARDGFSLLVQVARASRITKEHDDDFTFFVQKMTEGRIPAILAVTGCENEEPMDAWVDRNGDAFERFGYREVIACCFASGGPMETHYAPLRARSREALLESILRHSLREPARLYGPGTESTFDKTLTRVWNEFVALAGLPEKYRKQVNETAYGLLRRVGVPEEIAEMAIKHIPDALGEAGSKLPIPGSGPIVKRLSRYLLEKLLRRPAKPD